MNKKQLTPKSNEDGLRSPPVGRLFELINIIRFDNAYFSLHGVVIDSTKFV